MGIINRYIRFIDSITGESGKYDFADKSRCRDIHITTMLNRTHSMFKWEGLPKSIPQRSLELYLQCQGWACFAEHEGSLYAFTGGLGGEPDPYYMPTLCTVSNPALNLSKSYVIDKECVIVPNDYMYLGLLPIDMRYAEMLTENELSMRIATINTRVTSLLSASDDRTRESAEKYLEDVEDGKLGVVGENAFFDGIRSQPYNHTGQTNIITNLIENEQYFKASWFNEIGLNANYNMKRETINSGESELNHDALFPLVNTMLKCRREGIDKVNEMFGTDIRVSLDSSWQDNDREKSLELKNLDKDTGQTDTDTDTVAESEVEDDDEADT